MSSPSKYNEEPSSSNAVMNNEAGESSASEVPRPPAKRPYPSTVIEISDTESDDSDVCAVNSYQATADEVKRIRGEADYSTSSSSDYSSDSESPWEDDSILLEDDKKERKAVKAQLNPRANRMDDPKLNNKLKSQELIDSLITHWKELKEYSSPEITLTCEPFRLCLLHDFLANPDIINNIVDDMNTLDWCRKKMDLYEFHQTADLASLTWQRSIRGIYELLKTEVMTWVSKVTELELTSVSASCSLYGPGDHLLVHDDLLGDRRVAFILYLAPWRPNATSYTRRDDADKPLENGAGEHHHVVDVECLTSGWSSHMGGALQLISREDPAGAGGAAAGAGRVQHQVYPRNNMLAFFKVGHDSYHQVGEVVSLELPRLSINGWFHGPAPAPAPDPPQGAEEPPPAPVPHHEPHDEPQERLRPHNDVVLLNQWVEPTYMSPRSRGQIQLQMERASEVCLKDLLPEDKYEQVLSALRSADVEWEKSPSPSRHYERVSAAWVSGMPAEHAARALLRLLTGTAFFRLLADCTDLVLTAYHTLELQRWTAGDYTLLPPREQYQEARLEAVMYLGVPERPICGGSTTYLAPEEEGGEGSLVSLPPVNNALNLVYCDAGAASFTKYLSRMTMRDDDHFYILTCTYME